MAESKFLSLQDGFGEDNTADGLNDQCPEQEITPASSSCPGCIPNTNYIAPDWKGLDQTQPWFNERLCTYYITMDTTEVKTIPYSGSSEAENEDFINSVYDAYRESAAQDMLIGINKASGIAPVNLLTPHLKNEKFYLDPNPSSYLKLLYSIDYDTMESLSIPNVDPDSDNEAEQDAADDEESEDTDALAPGVYSVTLKSEDFRTGIDRLVQALRLYNRRYKMAQALDSVTLIYSKEKIVFPLRQVAINVGTIRDGLVSFIAKKGFSFGTGITINPLQRARGLKEVTSVNVSFRGDYRLNGLEVFYKGCEGKPITYKGKRIRRLKRLRAFKSTSAMGYIAAFPEMMSDLEARRPIPYLDFLIEHTFPEIKTAKGWPQEDPSLLIDGFEVPIRCSALATFLKRQNIQLGQDLMDQDFSLRDTLEHGFARTTNRVGIDRWTAQQSELGTIYAPTQINRDYVKGLALAQASTRISVNDDVYAICGRSFDMGFVEELREFLDRIKEEGLKEMILEALRSKMQGLSLRQALPVILGAALAGMSVMAYGRLYNRMSLDKRREIDSIVRAKIAEFNDGPPPPPPGFTPLAGGNINANLNAQSLAASGGSVVDLPAVDSLVGDTSRRLEFFRPWVLLKELHLEGSAIAKGSAKMPKISEYHGVSLNPSQKKARTLAKKLSTSRGKEQATEQVYDTAAMMVFFVEATIDAYTSDYLTQAVDFADSSIYDLLELLEGFPGTRLLAEFLRAADFPDTPLIRGGILEWMNDRLQQPLFRGATDLRIPYVHNPMFIRAKMMDFTYFLFEAARMAVQRAIMFAMSKMIQLICQAIDEGPRAAINSLKGARACGESLQNSFSKIMDEGILRYAGYTNRQYGEENRDSDTLMCTTIEMFQKFGAGASALSNPDLIMKFIDDLSCALTRKEMMETFLGDTSENTNRLIESLVDNQYPELSNMFDNVGSPGELFKSMGDTFPPEFRDKLQDFVDRLDDVDEMPANPSLCATEEDLNNFCELRARLLNGRSSAEQSNAMCEQSNEDLLQSLKDLASNLDDPMASAVPEKMISDPGCDNGLVPFQPEETVTAAAVVLDMKQEGLAIAFAEDMMNDSLKNPGFLNMIMSDTMGNPLSRHYSLVGNRRDYVNFYVESDGADQYGQFPAAIAPWLKTQLQDFPSTAVFESNNTLGQDRVITKTYDSLGISLFGGVQKVDLPEFGYNTTIDINAEDETVIFTRKARKENPDITLRFEDNNNGLSEFLDTPPAFAFNMRAFFSEFDSSGLNIYSDNVRLNVTYFDYQKSLGIPSSLKSAGPAGAATWLAEQAASALAEPQKSREYEFLSIESTLDNLDLNKYPLFAESFVNKEDYSPPFVLLLEFVQLTGVPLDTNNVTMLYQIYNSSQQAIYNNIANTVAENTAAFTYGATYDPLNKEMVSYVVDADQTDSPAGTAYEDATIDGEQLTEENMILGISNDQLVNGKDARVLYLDPNEYGGTYVRPPIYIKPLPVQGWMGFLDVVFPPEAGCGQPSDVINFADIVEEIGEAYKQIPEDDRLSVEECSVELPYNKMMTRLGTIQAEGAIRSACRIFAAVNLIKSLATITKFAPDFDELYSSMYAQFIVENMKDTLSAPRKKSKIFRGTLRDNDFWYRFLELAVQTYGRMVDEERIVDVPAHVLAALNTLNDLQETYKVPTRKKFRTLRRGGNPLAKSVRTLSAYRQAKKIEFIRSTEEPAKIILAQFVKENLNIVGSAIVENMSSIDLEPDFEKAAYYFMTELCHSNLDSALNKPLQEEVVNLPTTPGDGYYTHGGELVVEKNAEGDTSIYTEGYVGYYHIYEAAEGIQYLSGEHHIDDEGVHAILRPVSGEIIIPIGDLIDYEGVNNSSVTPDDSRPFVLEKYIAINGTKYSVSEAAEIIKSNDGALNISEVYPGTLEVVTRLDLKPKTQTAGDSLLDETAPTDANVEDWWNEPVGLEGELGVRYGIQLSMLNDGNWTRTLSSGTEVEEYSSDMLKVEILSVEMDVLDKKINEFVPFEANSLELLCMLNTLKENEKFKLLTEYIFPIKKHISLMAIYNNLAFLPSIGQITINPFNDVVSDAVPSGTGDTVPGVSVDVDSRYNVTYSNSDAWSSSLFRMLNGTRFGISYDQWDQTTYTNTIDQVKQTIDEAYYSVDDDFNTLMVRNFSPGQERRARPGVKLDKASLSREARRKLMEKLKPDAETAAGGDVLTRQQLKSVINNPFDAKGTLCKKG